LQHSRNQGHNLEDVFIFQTKLALEEARSEPRERERKRTAKVSKLSKGLRINETGIEQSDNTDSKKKATGTTRQGNMQMFACYVIIPKKRAFLEFSDSCMASLIFTPYLSAAKHRSTTTCNYIVAHNFQQNPERESLYKIPNRARYNMQITEVRYELSLQQKKA
jgi:hypothetical protein